MENLVSTQCETSFQKMSLYENKKIAATVPKKVAIHVNMIKKNGDGKKPKEN